MRILIVKLGAIGDIVHTLPALAALRRGLPDAHIAWAVERGGGAKLLQDNPALDELIELDMRGCARRCGVPLRGARLNERSNVCTRGNSTSRSIFKVCSNPLLSPAARVRVCA